MDFSINRLGNTAATQAQSTSENIKTGEENLFESTDINADLNTKSSEDVFETNSEKTDEKDETDEDKKVETLKQELENKEAKVQEKKEEYEELVKDKEAKELEVSEAEQRAIKKKDEVAALKDQIARARKNYEKAADMARENPDNAAYKVQVTQYRNEIDGLNSQLVRKQIEYTTSINTHITKQRELKELQKDVMFAKGQYDAAIYERDEKEEEYNTAVKEAKAKEKADSKSDTEKDDNTEETTV